MGSSAILLEGDYVTYPADAALNSDDCKLYRALDDIPENTEWDVDLWKEDTFWRGSWDQTQIRHGDYVSYPATGSYTLYKAMRYSRQYCLELLSLKISLGMSTNPIFHRC